MKHTSKSLFPWGKEVDISTEEWREYLFPKDGVLHKIRLDLPKTLVVTDNGHRVILASGISHYIPYGWIDLCWNAKKGMAKYYYQRKKP